MTHTSGTTPRIFSLDTYDVCHVTSIDGGHGLRIVTDPRRWAHAVEFTAQRVPGFETGSIVVDVSLDVESGEVEVGALSLTGTTFLCESRAGVGAHTIRLAIPAVGRCRSIVVRNSASDRSIVRILNITERRDGRVPDFAGDIDLSAPYGTSRRGFWDKNIFADVRRLAGADARTVFLVGAHHGGEASLYVSLFPSARIHCFEPAPVAFGVLREKLGDSDRVSLHQMALGDRSGRAAFHLNERDETNSLFAFSPSAHRYVDGTTARSVIDVPIATVDEVFERLALDSIDVLNLDVQGAELSVLGGASRVLEWKRVKVVIAELNWVPVYEGQGACQAILELLGKFGYHLYDFYNFAYGDSGQLLWGDAVFLS